MGIGLRIKQRAQSPGKEPDRFVYYLSCKPYLAMVEAELFFCRERIIRQIGQTHERCTTFYRVHSPMVNICL